MNCNVIYDLTDSLINVRKKAKKQRNRKTTKYNKKTKKYMYQTEYYKDILSTFGINTFVSPWR